MTTQPTPYVRLLFTGLLLALVGAHTLFSRPEERSQGATPVVAAASPMTPAEPRDSSVPPAPTTEPPAASATADPARTVTPRDDPSRSPARADEPEPVASGIPVSGDGPDGDYAVQRRLDQSTPADLQPALERRLVSLATRVWIAETTGTGRRTWPRYFTDASLRAPYYDVRVQAAIARRADGRDDQAVVRLVWAGAGASGDFQDGRPSQVRFALHHNVWEPVR